MTFQFFFPGWDEARAPCAAGPAPGAERLRTAYLDVLKLCLCDLAGTTTWGAAKTVEWPIACRELSGEELQLRAAGMDWPLQGLTMVGLDRLDDLQLCVESVVHDGIEGDLIEAGTWRGGASILMRATLDTLGADDRTVWVADSFQGFPSAENEQSDEQELSLVDFLAVPLDEVKANFARFGLDHGVEFVPGFFQDTMPGLAGQTWSIVRLDGDTYEATWLTLQSLYPDLAIGGYLIVDDYGALNECRKAVDEFREHHGISESLEKVDWTCRRWRRESDAPIDVAVPIPIARPVAVGSDGARSADSRPRQRARRIRTELELELERDLASARDRLARAERELALMREPALRGSRAWLRQKLRGRSRR